MAQDVWGGAADRVLSRDGLVNTLDDRDPEAVRQSRIVGRQLGLPGPTVEADLDGFKRQAEVEKAKSLFDYAPGLAAFAADPNNAAAIKDDLPAMAELGKMLGTRDDNGPLGKRFIDRMMGSTVLPYPLQERAAKYGTVARSFEPIAPNRAEGGLATDPTVSKGLLASTISNLVGKPALEVLDIGARLIGKEPEFRASGYRARVAGELEMLDRTANVQFDPLGEIGGIEINPGQIAYSGTASTIQMLGAIATRRPLTALSVSSGADISQAIKARGGGSEEALIAGIGTGLIEAGTERLPMEYLLGNFGKEATSKFIGNLLVREAPTEMLATVGQGAIDALTTGGKGWDRYVADLPQDLVNTAGATLVLGGQVGTLQWAARRMSPEVRALDDVDHATVGAAYLDKLMTKATESKVRQSDPETFKEFVASQTADTPVRDIYVPVEAINEYMQSEGYEAGALEAYQDQIAEAQATQGDVVIPVADAAAYLAGTPTWEALKDSVRLQPGGLSQKEALEQHAEIMKVLEQRGAEIAAEVEENSAVQSDAAEVYQDVRNRLLSGGVESKLAEHTAKVVAARYEARGARRGQAATEAWKAASVKFDWEVQGKRGKGRKLQQPGQPLVIGNLEYEVNEDGTYTVELAADKDRKTIGDKLAIKDLRKQLGDELTARILAGEGGTEGRRTIPNLDLTEEGGQLALRQAPPPTATINIGLNVNDGSKLTVQDAVEALSRAGVAIKMSRVAQSATEPTFIAELDRALTPEEATRVSEELRQDAIAQRVGEEGALFGPAAEKWGPFNPEFFLDLHSFNQDVMQSLPSGHDADPVGQRIVAYHGTPFDFDEFAPGKAIWFAEGRSLAERYADPRRFRKAGSGRVIEAEISIRAPLDLDPSLLSLPAHTVVENPVEWVKEQFGFDLKSHGWKRIGQDYAHAIFRSEAFASAAREAGYDTLHMTESGSATWGVLEPGTVMSPEDRELFQADPFYSALQRALEQNQTKRATGQQWAATLRKTPGIKQEELEWTGLLEYLEATEGLIERTELIELVERGGVQVEEVMLTAEQLNRPQVSYSEEDGQWGVWNGEEYIAWFDDEQSATDFADQAGAGASSQFQSWSSDPSNDTYRELLITLPVGVAGNPSRAPSTHWDTEGVVAHARFMDKTDADGKRVLFIEEVQSDWHQKGRDEGYETGLAPEEIATIRSKSQEANKARDDAEDAVVAEAERLLSLERLKPNGDLDWVESVKDALGSIVPQVRINAQRSIIHTLGGDKAVLELYERANLRANEAAQAVVNANKPGIPNAPFKSSWPALVMKRMIRYAAENGYERVAWTTGEEQAERYNLGAVIDDLRVQPGPKGSVLFHVLGPTHEDTRRVQDIILDQLSGSDTLRRHNWVHDGLLKLTREEAMQVFGSDLGARAFDAGLEAEDAIEVDDLRVGGEGMKAFYDRNLVNITNDIIKKYGSKVEKIEVENIEMVSARNRGNTINPGFDVTDKMRDAAMQGFTLFQGPRGSTSFLSDGVKLVSLFETANESTLIHEFGHIWLEELRADAASDTATEQEKADWASLVKWWKAQGVEVGDGEIPTEAHEFFARTFERYFREGKAPRRDLRAAFKAFGDWLKNIYRAVAAMNAPINPTLRGIFDRMLATDEAIDAYRAQERTGPLFNNAEEAGMTEAEFAAYGKLVENARDTAYDTLLEKTMAAIRLRRRQDMREQRANVRSEIADTVNARPEFVALHLLRTGRWLGDPQRAKQDVKLNTGWLIDTFGEEILDKLPRGLPIIHGEGQDGDTIAEMVGAQSGHALVQALVGMRVQSEALRASGETRSLRDKMIDEQVDEIMVQRHGDVLEDGTIEEEAIAALNTAAQGEIIGAEIRQLAKRATKAQPLTPYQFAREWAKRKVRAGRVNDTVSRSALQRYTRATAKAARLAETAILEGEVDEAYRQKQAQLLNHALLAESKAAADEVDTVIKRMRTLAGRAAMKSVDQDYMDKIHMLLENYDFRQRSQRSIEEQEGFQAWAERQRANGFEVHIPPRLENRGDPYSRVTVEELLSLNDLVQSLLHIGRTKQKLKTAQQERDFGEFVDEVVARVEQLPQRKLPEKPINEDRRLLASAASELLKIETIVEELDGGPTGPLHDAIVVGATNAENRRNQLRHDTLLPIVAAYHNMSRKQKNRLNEKVTLTELTWNTLNEGDPRQGQPVTITRSELLSIALNMGNLSNLEKLSKGERWPIPTLQSIMDRELTKEDWDLVQLLWRQVDSLWTDIVATEREMSGVVPEKVVPVPIETRFGTYEGGYWPVVYDAARWQRAENLEEAKLDDMFGLVSGVATQKGHTISRTEAFGPINLSLENVLFQHLEQVVTRIAFTSYARDVMRIIQQPRIRGIIDTRLGPEYRKQIKPWLSNMIHEGQVDAQAARWWQGVLKQARINMMVAAMGFRFSTGIAQTLGLAASAQRIGAVNVARGLKRIALSPRASAEFAFSRSSELINRTNAANREVSEVFAQLRGKHSRLAEAQAWAFWHIGMIDRYMVALPTWLGAHQKGMDEGMTDAEASAYADKSVRLSQGAGPAKDLSAWQSSNNPAWRFLTMFYSPFNVMFNAQWQGIRGLKKGQLAPMIGVTFWWLVVSTLADALMSGDWPEDDEEGEKNWLGWFGRNVFFGAFAGLPLIRDGATYAERKIIGEYAEFGQTPVTKIGDAVERTYKIGDKLVAEGEAPERPLKQAGDLTAILTGTPTSQAGTTGQFLWDYSQGEVDPQGVSDWYFGITRGKVPEEKSE